MEGISIKKQYEKYFTYDRPIPYFSVNQVKRKKFLFDEINNLAKNPSLTYEQKILLETYTQEFNSEEDILYINPVTMDKYFEFFYSVQCLMIEKNKISDVKILSMSYLDFLFYMINNDKDGNTYAEMLYEILNLTLGVEDSDLRYLYDNDGRVKLIIKNIEYNKKDFDNIKRIICYQNMPNFDDEYINPELKEAIEEAENLKNEVKGTITLEDQIISVSISSPYKTEDIYKMTIRKFIKTLQKVDSKLHYQIYKTGEISGMVSFKEEILHWMYTKDNKFDSLIKYNSFKKKIEAT